MPEIRYAQVYRDGKLMTEEPCEVSGDDLVRESAERLVEQLSARADDDLTTLELAQFLKALARLR